MDDMLTLDEALAELTSAEDFLDYFGVEYVPSVVQVNRLHILQRFHDYLEREPGEFASGDEVGRATIYRRCLRQAYEDFVKSDALTEKVFRVFHSEPLPEGGQSTFVPLDKVFK
jgi:nitrogenase-stabilizing/protective protein